MKTLYLQVLVLSFALLSGCAAWPPEGTGGFAEHRLEKMMPELYHDVIVPADGLRFELELLARHLDVLVLEGAELCFPATVVQAKHIEARIVREITGGLDFDAANDIIVQRNLLKRLERQLDYVLSYGVCRLPMIMVKREAQKNAIDESASGEKRKGEQNTPGELGKRIYDLLNADNQFAFGSFELNPKYIGRLAEAAKLLVEFPEYYLRITGHTDSIGTEKGNAELSRNRAEQVARYLQIFGISSNRLSIDSVGASDPLFKGIRPEIRLTNRRVSIELIESTTSMPSLGGNYE